MRWLYIPDEDDPDFIAKQETISRIEKWWQDFESVVVPMWKTSSNLSENLENTESEVSDFSGWVAENIHRIHPNIMWEFHKNPSGDDDFVCTVEDSYTDGALIQTMVEMAPQLDQWCFLRYRPPCEFDTIPEFLKHSAGLNVPNDIRVSWVKSEINKIDLCYFSGTFTGDLRIDLVLTLKLTSAILGEEMFENWINGAEALRPISTPIRMLNNLIGKSSPVTHNTSNLLNQCLKIKKQIEDSLPDKYVSELIFPHHHDDTPVCMWHRTPNEDAVPAYIPRRLIYCFTIESLLKAVLSGIYFHSHCHSKLNEIFCFIEITDFDMGQNDSLEREITLPSESTTNFVKKLLDA